MGSRPRIQASQLLVSVPSAALIAQPGRCLCLQRLWSRRQPLGHTLIVSEKTFIQTAKCVSAASSNGRLQGNCGPSTGGPGALALLRAPSRTLRDWIGWRARFHLVTNLNGFSLETLTSSLESPGKTWRRCWPNDTHLSSPGVSFRVGWTMPLHVRGVEARKQR